MMKTKSYSMLILTVSLGIKEDNKFLKDQAKG
jgi:hypothetical protein